MMNTANKNFIPLICIVFIDSLAYFLVIPALIVLLLSPHSTLLNPLTSTAARYNLYAIALAISPLAFLLASPVVGHLSDRFGRKKTMLYCLIAGLIGFALPIIGIMQHKLSLVFLGRLIAGGSTASQPIAQAAITDFSSGKQKALYLSLIGFAMTAAMVIGPVVGGLLTDHSLSHLSNPTLPYWLGSVLAAFNIILLIKKFNDTKVTPIKQSKTPQRHTLLPVLFNKKIIILMLIFLCLELGWSLYYQAIYLILNQHLHYTVMKMSLFVGYIGLWMCLGLTIIFRWLIKRFELYAILKGSLLLATGGLVICSLFFNITGQWLGVIPTAIGTGVVYPCLLTLLSNHTAKTHQGWILGCASTVLSVAWMLSGFASGEVANVSLRLPIIIAGVFFILSTTISLSKNYEST